MSFVRRLFSSNIGQLVLELILIIVPVLLLTSLLNLLPAAFQKSAAGDLILNVLLAVVIFVMFALGLRKIEHTSLAEVGFARQQWLRQTLHTITLGGALMTLVTLALAITGSYHITGTNPFAIVELVFQVFSLSLLTLLFARSKKIGFFHYVLFILLLVGFISTFVSLLILIGGAIQEELIFRGTLFRKLERSFGSWIALTVSAILFGIIHLVTPHATLVGALAIAVTAGVLIAAVYILTRSLWWAIGIHLGWNYFEGAVYGTQLSGHSLPGIFTSILTGPTAWSGGDFGPEAGLASILLVGMFGFYLCYHAARQKRMLPRKQAQRIPEDTQPEPTDALSK